jgi:hypothetical protein
VIATGVAGRSAQGLNSNRGVLLGLDHGGYELIPANKLPAGFSR